MCESVANTVNFIQNNLLKDNFLSGQSAYDVIFCRNLLIYFDDSAKKQAIKTLNRLLTQQGLLFVGHSETRQILASGFVSVRHPLAFAHRKAEKSESPGILPIPTLTTYTPLKIPAPSINHTFFPTDNRQPSISQSLNNQQSATSISLQSKEQPSLLQNAKDLADQGQLNEAVKLCEAYLTQDPLSAEAYLLCGQVYQAMGNQEEAEKHFQKAVYLEPNHYDALFHLALIKEHQGDLKQAEIIRKRVQRINNS
ncbi:MAG: CheR family methyltransferase [Crinalium sp.]